MNCADSFILVKPGSIEELLEEHPRLAGEARRLGHDAGSLREKVYEMHSYEEIGEALDDFDKFAQELGFGYDRNNMFFSAAIEAVMNAFQHGNREDTGKVVRLYAGAQPGRFAFFIVEDEGRPDFEQLKERIARRHEYAEKFSDIGFEGSRRGGGFGIMDQLLDTLYVDCTKAGTAVMGAIYEKPTTASAAPR